MPATWEKITERTVARCIGGDPKARPNTFVRDTAQAGFAIRIGKTKSTYIVEGRIGRGGDVRRPRLGTVGRLELDEARMQAKERIAELARGSDPTAALRARRGVSITMQQALEVLAATRDVKPATVASYRKDIASLGWLNRRLAGIKNAEVLAAYDLRKAKHSSTARIFRSFRSVWNAAKAEHPSLPQCPTVALRNRKKWATARSKRRVIADANLPAWRKQVDALDRDDVRDLLLFLHYSGCRVGESRALTVNDVDLKAGTFTLAEPKNGRPVDLPVTKQVHAILARRLKAGGDSLFPQGDVRKSHASVDAAPWSYHDLRRSYVTMAHRLGVDDEIARALTNHASSSGDAHGGYVTMTADTLRPEAQRIADHLDKVARTRNGANVIPLRRRA